METESANSSAPSTNTPSTSMADALMTSTSSAKSSKTIALLQSMTKCAWDPFDSKDWEGQSPTPMLIKRVQRDLQQCFSNPPCGIFVVPDNEITLVHAVVVGPFDTPYEGGFFYFIMRMPPDYPLKPPRVRLMTTGNDTVRFNPNLYKNGKVCLSILGTWHGPSWVASLTLESVLLSIQSLMNEKPYHNEPGFETERAQGDAERYNQIIQHETVRVAVCEMLEGTCTAAQKCPPMLIDVMRKSFMDFYDHYIQVCHSLINKGLQGSPMIDPFTEQRGVFDPQSLIERLEKLKCKLENQDDTEEAMDL